MQATPARITTDELKEALARDDPLTLVDVRDPDEYRDWHIPGAKNIPVDKLLAGADPGPGPVVTICAHGPRSLKAAEALRARGIDARPVEGGMVGWNSTYHHVDVPCEPARVIQLQRLGKGCLSYLIVSGSEALVLDPSIDLEEYTRAAAELHARITLVVDTHAHADHVSGGRALADAHDAEYWAPAEVGERIAHETLADGLELRVGAATLRAIATPGHTPGSMSLLLGDLAFTGDTLFAESVGRPDLGQDPRPNAAVLYATLHERLLTLPSRTRVVPAHAAHLLDPRTSEPVSATIGTLAKTQAPLQLDKSAFVEWVAKNAAPKPGNFEEIKRINRGEDAMPPTEDTHELEAGPNRCAVG